MARTSKEFRDAVSYLSATGNLPAIGAKFIDANNQIVLDEGDNNADITPDEAMLTQALADLATQITSDYARQELRQLSHSEAIGHFRNRLISANGNGTQLLELYTDARAYETRNTNLAAIMVSKRLIRETAIGRKLNLTTNQDKAIYMELFESALVLIAIDDN